MLPNQSQYNKWIKDYLDESEKTGFSLNLRQLLKYFEDIKLFFNLSKDKGIVSYIFNATGACDPEFYINFANGKQIEISYCMFYCHNNEDALEYTIKYGKTPKHYFYDSRGSPNDRWLIVKIVDMI